MSNYNVSESGKAVLGFWTLSCQSRNVRKKCQMDTIITIQISPSLFKILNSKHVTGAIWSIELIYMRVLITSKLVHVYYTRWYLYNPIYLFNSIICSKSLCLVVLRNIMFWLVVVRGHILNIIMLKNKQRVPRFETAVSW